MHQLKLLYLLFIQFCLDLTTTLGGECGYSHVEQEELRLGDLPRVTQYVMGLRCEPRNF